MKPLPELPDLQILPTDSLQPHEHIDEQRAEPIIRSLEQEGILRNPPVVLPVTSLGTRFVVLDGANRTTAFRLLGIPHVLVQVVHAGDSSVDIRTWNHAILAEHAEDLLTRIRAVAGIELTPSDEESAAIEIRRGGALSFLSFTDGEVYEIRYGEVDLAGRLERLNGLVATYNSVARMERTSVARISNLNSVHPDLSCLVVFPRFEVDDVIDAAAQGLIFPSGVTRFIVSPRALHLNYPLERLRSSESLAAKQAQLVEWIHERMEARKIRYYAESTILFDE